MGRYPILIMDKSKYQICDHLPNAPNIYIRGITTLSNGKKRYFLQNNDNTFVFDEDELDNLIIIVSNLH